MYRVFAHTTHVLHTYTHIHIYIHTALQQRNGMRLAIESTHNNIAICTYLYAYMYIYIYTHTALQQRNGTRLAIESTHNNSHKTEIHKQKKMKFEDTFNGAKGYF